MNQDTSTIAFPVIRGTQATRTYYVAMWSYRMMKQITIFDDSDLSQVDRIQRTLNEKRIPEIKNYILKNPEDYIFSAITASIDSNVKFEPFGEAGSNSGILKVPMDAKFVINDGQHRRKAILEALEESPELASETIAVVFYLDPQLKRSQQMFADLNGQGVKTGKAINALFDHRDHYSNIARTLAKECNVFRRVTEFEKVSLAKRSKHLFTFSSIVSATEALLKNITTGDALKDYETSKTYWETVAACFPQWRHVAEGSVTAGEIRESDLSTSGLMMQVLGRVGSSILQTNPNNWKSLISKLSTLDFDRYNPIWKDTAIIQEKISKSGTSIALCTTIVKRHIGAPLDDNDYVAETSLGN